MVSSFQVHLPTPRAELVGFFVHSGRQRFFALQALFGRISADVLSDLHAAELRAAHTAEMGRLGRGGRQCLVVVRPGTFRIQRKAKLVLPAELETGAGQRVVPRLGTRMALSEIGGMGSDFVDDHAFLDVVLVGQAEVLFGCDVAEHGGAVPTDHCRTDGRGDVVVAWGDVGRQGTKRVKGSFMATSHFSVDVFLNHVQGDMAGPFDHDLDVVFPGDAGQLPQGLQLGKLGRVVGIGDGPRPQPIA